MTLRLAAALLAASLCVGAVLAAEGAPPGWSQLTASQQSALAPLQRDWAGIDSQQKAKWLEVAGRYPKMSPADRQRLQGRMAAWARMTPAERTRARMQFKESRQFSPEDRQARWEAYQALPDDERRKLAQQRARPAVKASAAGNNSGDPAPKRNIVSPARQAAAKPVAPTVVQARPGATTSVMSTRTPAPAHQQPGLPKIAATEGFVHPDTLLPRRGAQGAAVSAASAPDDRP